MKLYYLMQNATWMYRTWNLAIDFKESFTKLVAFVPPHVRIVWTLELRQNCVLLPPTLHMEHLWYKRTMRRLRPQSHLSTHQRSTEKRAAQSPWWGTQSSVCPYSWSHLPQLVSIFKFSQCCFWLLYNYYRNIKEWHQQFCHLLNFTECQMILKLLSKYCV